MKKVFIYGYDKNANLIYEVMKIEDFEEKIEKIEKEIQNFRNNEYKGYVASCRQAAIAAILGYADESKICGVEEFITEKELENLIKKHK